MIRVFVVAGFALLAQGCTVVVSASEEQCASDADCTARGFANATCSNQVCIEKADGGGPQEPWDCLGNVVEPVPDPSKSVTFPMKLVYALGGAAVSESTVVDVCDKLDATCIDPDPRYPKGLHPDAAGVINVEVPEGFDGFVQITGPELVDSRIYVGRPIVDPPAVKEIQLLAPTHYSILADQAGQTLDPTRGTAIVLAVDCQGIGASGVRLETPNADANTLAFYLINQFPTAPPTAEATDKDGFGGFFNLPTGPAVVRAYRASDDVFIGESSFQSLANTISYVQVAPTPQ